MSLHTSEGQMWTRLASHGIRRQSSRNDTPSGTIWRRKSRERDPKRRSLSIWRRRLSTGAKRAQPLGAMPALRS